MNPTDITVDAGINVTGVGGLDKVYNEIRKSAAKGVADGVRVGAERASANLASYAELRSRAQGTPRTAERMGALLAARARLNIASSFSNSLSNESAIIIAAEREALAQDINRTRAVLKKAPAGIYSARAMRSVTEELIATPTGRIITKGEDLATQQKRAMNTWLETQASISERGLKKLSLGELLSAKSQLEDAYAKSAALDEYRSTRGSKKKIITTDEQKEYDETMLLINKEIAKNTKKGADGTQALLRGYRAGLAIFGGGAIGTRIAQSIAKDVNEYYASDKPFTTLRDKLFARTTQVGTATGAATGATIGTTLGAIVGTLLAPFTGGASIPVGMAIGGGLGGAAGGFGTYTWLNDKLQKSVAAAQPSQALALQTMRYRGLYGATAGEGGWQFAKAMEATGLATTEDAETLASNSQMFQAALAFGGVSDQQMLGLSMLPNYYAALAGGATPEQAFQAYRKDIDGMSPGLAQYASKLAGVPDNLRALANNPALADRMMTEGYGTAVGLEREMGQYAMGFAQGRYTLEMADMRERRTQWRQARRQDVAGAEYNYDPTYEGVSYHYDQATNDYIKYNAAAAKPYTSPTGLGEADKKGKDLVKRELNIYVGQEKTTIGHVYTDAEIGDQISYAIGEM